jgi:phytoene dehydrogenase-like protein
VDDINRMGGKVVCHAEVNKLEEKDGRIVAARCSKGDVYEGDVFISDVHPQVTFGWLDESKVIKNMFRRRINAMENSTGILTVSLVLKKGVLPYFNHNKYYYRKPNVWTFSEDVGGVGGVMVSCRVPEEGDYARQIDLMTPVSWKLFEAWEHTTVGHRGESYDMLKNHLADECIHLAERVVPELGSMVEKRYISTPLTYRDYTLSPCGSAYGVRKDCRNILMTTLSPRTSIPNLLLTGQSLMLHGVEGVTMTALQTCGELLGKDYIQTIIK